MRRTTLVRTPEILAGHYTRSKWNPSLTGIIQTPSPFETKESKYTPYESWNPELAKPGVLIEYLKDTLKELNDLNDAIKECGKIKGSETKCNAIKYCVWHEPTSTCMARNWEDKEEIESRVSDFSRYATHIWPRYP